MRDQVGWREIEREVYIYRGTKFERSLVKLKKFFECWTPTSGEKLSMTISRDLINISLLIHTIISYDLKGSIPGGISIL